MSKKLMLLHFLRHFDECCREAEIIRNTMNTVLWNDLDELLQEITSLMAAHVDTDKASLITVKTVLDLAKRAKEIFDKLVAVSDYPKRRGRLDAFRTFDWKKFTPILAECKSKLA